MEANIKMDIDAPEINTETNGSGDIFLKGETKSFEGEIHGSGNIKALDLRSGDATIKIYGSGDADVFVEGKLDVHVAGSGDVNYKGNAQISSSIARQWKSEKSGLEPRFFGLKKQKRRNRTCCFIVISF